MAVSKSVARVTSSRLAVLCAMLAFAIASLDERRWPGSNDCEIPTSRSVERSPLPCRLPTAKSTSGFDWRWVAPANRARASSIARRALTI